MDSQVISQVQALHQLIVDNYYEPWHVLPGKHEGAIAKLMIHLREIFPNNKAGRENRLDTLCAILPILESKNGKPYSGIDLTTTKKLWMCEVYALLSWLEENGAAKKALVAISRDPLGWSLKLRSRLSYIERPKVYGGCYAQEEQGENKSSEDWQMEMGAASYAQPEPHI